MNHSRFAIASAIVTMQAAAAEAAGFPCDVSDFVEQRNLCDHFRGEEPYDTERAAFLEQSIARYCTGTDEWLKELKAKYANDAEVLAKLNAYEPQIEQ